MSVSKYVSDVKVIPQPIEVVFNKLSNFENFAKYISDDLLSAITDKIPQVSIRNFQCDKDSCIFEIGGIGNAELRIVERTPFSTIKIEGQGGLPLELKFWIQLLSVEESETKLRLTLHADMGIMIKMLVGDKLEKGIEQLAGVLAMLPY
jgi:carbon monoxide dehydrogenase subunit G